MLTLVHITLMTAFIHYNTSLGTFTSPLHLHGCTTFTVILRPDQIFSSPSHSPVYIVILDHTVAPSPHSHPSLYTNSLFSLPSSLEYLQIIPFKVASILSFTTPSSQLRRFHSPPNKIFASIGIW